MRVMYLAVALTLTALPVLAQDEPAPSPPENTSSQAQARSGSTRGTPQQDLPVSLDRIREGLKRSTEESLLKKVDIPPDFRIKVEEKRSLDEILSKMDFKSGPAPAGGLYGYEQQRRLFNPTTYPLSQPYAAFSGGELITIALENLIRRYLGGRLMDAVSDAERESAERAARQEVDRNIAAYCAARPDRDAVQLCTTPLDR